MSDLSDREFVRSQYGNSTNLNSRIDLHKLFSVNPYGWHRWVVDRLALPPAGRVLELGCGTGLLWVTHSDRIPTGLDLVLTDLSPGMVTQAKQSLHAMNARAAFCAVDAQAIPFRAELFDVVIANHMLYHVPDRSRAYAEILRVLKPGGRFYATTIGEAHMRELNDMLGDHSANDSSKQIAPFTLESGLPELSGFFDNVAIVRYEDALEVTEVEPLVQYAASSGALTDDELALLEEDVTRRMAAEGSIHITKDSGIFSARKS